MARKERPLKRVSISALTPAHFDVFSRDTAALKHRPGRVACLTDTLSTASLLMLDTAKTLTVLQGYPDVWCCLLSSLLLKESMGLHSLFPILGCDGDSLDSL